MTLMEGSGEPCCSPNDEKGICMAEIIDSLAGWTTLDGVARQLNLTPSAVKYRVWKFGLPTRKLGVQVLVRVADVRDVPLEKRGAGRKRKDVAM